jgi:hypothetical protein
VWRTTLLKQSLVGLDVTSKVEDDLLCSLILFDEQKVAYKYSS